MIEHLDRLSQQYTVSFTVKSRMGFGTCSETRKKEYDATVTLTNEGRKLTGFAWALDANAALSAALLKVARQADALDGLD